MKKSMVDQVKDLGDMNGRVEFKGDLFIDRPRGFQGFSISDTPINLYKGIKANSDSDLSGRNLQRTLCYR